MQPWHLKFFILEITFSFHLLLICEVTNKHLMSTCPDMRRLCVGTSCDIAESSRAAAEWPLWWGFCHKTKIGLDETNTWSMSSQEHHQLISMGALSHRLSPLSSIKSMRLPLFQWVVLSILARHILQPANLCASYLICLLCWISQQLCSFLPDTTAYPCSYKLSRLKHNTTITSTNTVETQTHPQNVRPNPP